MKVTNKHNLPEPLVKAVSASNYNKGGADYSATELLNPPQLVQLKRRHWEALVEDASERIWALLGSAIHHVLQAANLSDHLQEERLFLEVGGRKVKGQPDLYKDGLITDYKVTSVWSRIFGDRKPEWEAQVNIYAELYEAAGFPVKDGAIVCIYRDWSEREAQKDPERYPQAPAEAIPVGIWKPEERRMFLEARVAANVAAEGLADKDLPNCTAEEVWEKKPTWAVMKEGRKSALRVFSSEAQATKMSEDTKGTFVEHRPGERTRCERYCPVKDLCMQYRAYKSGGAA